MRRSLIEAARKHYEAKRAKAMANLDVYINDSVGVGEHADIAEEVVVLLSDLTTAEDVLKIIDEYFPGGE